MPSTSAPPPVRPSGGSSPILTADSLILVRDPLRWPLALGSRTCPSLVAGRVRTALAGPRAHWTPPRWLLAHQIEAARRIAGALDVFGGALLCDAVGLGKTYVALAVAIRYQRPIAVVPAVLRDQWTQTAARLAVPITVVSHESLSRGGSLPHGDCCIVDEAHRFRNANTARYDRLARGTLQSHVLLVTATPVVNTPADLANLIRLFSPDHALAAFGIDSLEAIRSGAERRTFARCILPLVVSRTAAGAGIPDGAIPDIHDTPVINAPTLAAPLEQTVIAGVHGLRFPTFASRSAAQLLRLHLFHRLSSSVAACAVTLRRHEAYLERAIETARRGERLTRREARRLFDPDDDHQLDLAFPPDGPTNRIDVEELHEELSRIQALRDLVANAPPDNAKLRALRDVLESAPARRTIVFVTSVHTAMDLARELGWRNVVAVSGRGARIASGALPVREALALFAPNGQGAREPPARTRARVLVATDLVSEGLDLQDAQQVVHYDLPWTPLRLQQRVGRVARLGASHAHVTVRWFAPSPTLDRELRLRDRIATKEQWQRNLAVAVSSRLGASTVVGYCLGRRETLLGPGGDQTAPTGRRDDSGPHHALVSGPRAAALVLEWRWGTVVVPTVAVLAGLRWRPVQPIDRWLMILEDLLQAPESAHRRPSGLETGLEDFVRARLGAALNGPRDPETLALARRLVQMGRTTATAREAHRLPDLEGALDRVVGGLPIGAARWLRDVLRNQPPWRELRRWMDGVGAVEAREGPTVVLRAALIGDGTRGS